MSELSDIERRVTICIMKQDCDAIYSLLKTERDPIFAMEVIPYYALFIQSCQEYLGENFLKATVAKELKDIRNHIKTYSEGFGKSRKKILRIDNEQDEDFKTQLRFEFLKNYNIHLNFGSYWTDDKHIIGNTQQLADFLSVKSMDDPNLNDRLYQIGEQIGSIVSLFKSGLDNSLKGPLIERKEVGIAINYYYDINTNRHNNLFANGFLKELNLFFINLLCNMNFVKHILNKLFIDGNIWIFRVKYNVTYYTYRALERLKNYCENNKEILIEIDELSNVIAQGEKVFNSNLRSCMMHYNLEGANVITLENIDKEFFGIIESCFVGMSYQEYLSLLDQYSNLIINYLENQFDFSEVKLEKI